MIDILIVNYNCATRLKSLIENLTHPETAVISRRADYEITVIDNNSRDGSVTMMESQFPGVTVIPRSSNDGYSAAINEGLASTGNRDILLLNSDVLITPAAVAAMARIWERLDFPGIIGPLHFEEDGFPQLTWGSSPTAVSEKRRQRLDRALARRETWARQEVLAEACRTREVDWVSGSCMFFARSTVEDIGPWDQNYFLYFEDIDWCLRAKEKGYRVYHTSEAQITHAHGASTANEPDAVELEYRRSQCYFTKKHFGSWALFKCRSYLTAKQVGRWLIGHRSGFDRRTTRTILREIWRKPGV